MSSGVNENKVPISEKTVLSVQECSALTGIGQNTLENALDEKDCPFVLKIGRKKMIIRKAFDAYIEKYREIKTKSPNDNKDVFDLRAENINGNYKVFPDRGAHSATKVYSLLGHLMLENAQNMTIIDEETGVRNFESIKHVSDTKDQIIYSPEDISYDKSDNNFSTVADLMKSEWDMPLYEEQKPLGVYVANGQPSHNVIIDSGQRQSREQIIKPLLDVWSRDKNPCNLVITDRDGVYVSEYAKILEKRGYSVKIIDCATGRGSVGYNPFRAAIDAVRTGDFAKCAMYVDTALAILVPNSEDEDPVWGPACRYVFKTIIYTLIGFAFEREKQYKEKHGLEELTDTAILDGIWSSVNISDVKQVLLQISQENYSLHTYMDSLQEEIYERVKSSIWNGRDSVCGLFLFSNIVYERVSDENIKNLIKSNLDAIKAVAGNYDNIPRLINAVVKIVEKYIPEDMCNIVNCKYSKCLDVRTFVDYERPIVLFVTWANVHSGTVAKIFSNLVKQISGAVFDSKYKNEAKRVKRGTRYVIEEVPNLINKDAHLETDISMSLGVDHAYTVVVNNSSICREYFGDAFGDSITNRCVVSTSDDETADMLTKKSEKISELNNTVNVINYNDIMFLPTSHVISIVPFTNDIIRSRNDTTLPSSHQLHFFDEALFIPYDKYYFVSNHHDTLDYGKLMTSLIDEIQ